MTVAAQAESRTSADLRAEVERALWDFDLYRLSENDLEIEVRPDGALLIEGHVSSRLIKDGILEVTRWLPNVREVIDAIIADGDLEIEVAWALAKEPRLQALPPGTLRVDSRLGNVTLMGRLPDPSLAKPLLETAQAVDGVRLVRWLPLG